jgi:hypothetical protein
MSGLLQWRTESAMNKAFKCHQAHKSGSLHFEQRMENDTGRLNPLELDYCTFGERRPADLNLIVAFSFAIQVV